MSLPTEIARFLEAFETFERHRIDAAIESLTAGGELLKMSPKKKLGLHARLTLIKRLAMTRAADSRALALIDRIIDRSDRLQQKYDSLQPAAVRRPASRIRGSARETERDKRKRSSAWLPTMMEVDEAAGEAAALMRMLDSVVERCLAGDLQTSPIAGVNDATQPPGVRIH